MATVPRLMRETGALLEFNCNPIGCFRAGWPRVITVHDLYSRSDAVALSSGGIAFGGGFCFRPAFERRLHCSSAYHGTPVGELELALSGLSQQSSSSSMRLALCPEITSQYIAHEKGQSCLGQRHKRMPKSLCPQQPILAVQVILVTRLQAWRKTERGATFDIRILTRR